MLHEIAVENLGVVDRVSLVIGPGMTAVTGETGAGKTLLVTAISLLVGGRASPEMVRPGADEARVEGRFTASFDSGDDEVVLARVIPADGRSRAYINGRLATASELVEIGERLVDLHGQHTHQSLLSPAVQRDCLDSYGKVNLQPLQAAEAAIRAIDVSLAELGGDERQRARELDLLRFQVSELEAAALEDPSEEEYLAREAELLGSANAHRETLAHAVEALVGDEGAVEKVGQAVARLAGRAPFAEFETRARALEDELSELAGDIRSTGEEIDDDPARITEVAERRKLLGELRRKYGESLAAVIEYWSESADRLSALESFDERAAQLELDRVEAVKARDNAADKVKKGRVKAAPKLAADAGAHLGELAMPKARLEVRVEGDAGSDVEFLLAANVGEPALPLSKTASGGELARTMLAIRRVLSEAPPVLVFDEVDAGIGGRAALAVGSSLQALGRSHQVLVVTHLAQVAAHADKQVVIEKSEVDGRTVSTIRTADGDDRVVEISRMLSGQPDSASAREHAAELLAEARGVSK